MVDQHLLQSLIQPTISKYLFPHAQVVEAEIVPMAEDERGWSGEEIRRYRTRLHDGQTLTVLTKTMPLRERRVMHLLSEQGHANVPFTFSPDQTTEASVPTCMQDLGSLKVGIPTGEDITPPSEALDQQVAQGLAALHVSNLKQNEAFPWLPRADMHYMRDFLLQEVWRGTWDRTLSTNPAFAREFAAYTPRLERAAERFLRSFAALWQEGNSLTLTHGEVHGEHVMLFEKRPYFIDWGWASYGPFYLDLPAYFTPRTVHHYRNALAAHGIEVSEADFMERYHEIGRYVGFKYLCTGVWQWGQGPTAQVGQRLLLTLKWAIDGTWSERAFAVSPDAWAVLLAEHKTLQQ